MTLEDFDLTRRRFIALSSAAIAAPLILNAAGSVLAAEKKEKKATYFIGPTCIGCHHCFYNCPQGAIHWGTDKYEIDQTKCVQCGTCYETCNISAASKKES
jgi:ferredoxin